MIQIKQVVPQCDFCPTALNLLGWDDLWYHAHNRHGHARLWLMGNTPNSIGYEILQDAPRPDDGGMGKFLAWMEHEDRRWILLTAWGDWGER